MFHFSSNREAHQKSLPQKSLLSAFILHFSSNRVVQQKSILQKSKKASHKKQKNLPHKLNIKE